MQTTLRISDRLYRRAKAKASELGLSLTRFLEAALEERLDRMEAAPSSAVRLPVSSAVGATVGVDQLQARIAAADLEEDRRKLN